MEAKITATELARSLGDVLGKVRYRGEVFVIERNGEAVARLGPVPSTATPSLRDGLLAWRRAGVPDADFADDLERVGAADRPPRNPWG
jgi:antitoxin (DNA-binding transcriptional repressor) of toxin-antitoxin stability system